MAVFVPYPHAVDDHQTANAKFLVDGKAALIMPQQRFNTDSVVELLTPYLTQPELISEHSAAALQLAVIDATANVAKHCAAAAGEQEPLQIIEKRDS